MPLSRMAYSLVRYVPDSVRGEAVNLGVIVVSDDRGESDGRFLPRPRWRAKVLTRDVNGVVIERALESMKRRLGPAQQGHLLTVGGLTVGDDRISNEAGLSQLHATMRNQIQLSEPKKYRAESVPAAVHDLYHELVLPRSVRPQPKPGMTLAELRKLIAETVRQWAPADVNILESGFERHLAQRRR